MVEGDWLAEIIFVRGNDLKDIAAGFFIEWIRFVFDDSKCLVEIAADIRFDLNR